MIQRSGSSTEEVMTTNLQRRSLKILYFSQFLSAFADNMILYITLAIINANHYPAIYLAIVQACFLLAYVVLAPFVGTFADRNAKSAVLWMGNGIKGAGILLLILGLDPAFCYAIVGIGAALYSPAKYGILTELTSTDHELLKANAKLEGYTIFAILTGSVAGGFLAGYSIGLAMGATMLLYAISLGVALWIPKRPGRDNLRYAKELRIFFSDTARLFDNPKTSFSLIGTGSFWMTSAVVRLAIIAWIPLHLGITSINIISMLTAVTGVGIIIGSLSTPALIPVRKYFNSYRYGLFMVLLLLILPWLHNVTATIGLLLLVGFSGGVFIVPMNTALQEAGNGMVGVGKTIAVQNLVENVLMLAGVGLYSIVGTKGISVETSLTGIALVLFLFVGYLILQLRKVKDAANV
jgi:MFS transporter, LPLT family, lysophospholipid transporter